MSSLTPRSDSACLAILLVPRRSTQLVLLLAFAAVSVRARADDLKNVGRSLAREFKGKTMALRNRYQGERLVYNSEGEPVQGYAHGTWTLDGHVAIKEMKLKRDRLELEGDRVLAAYDSEKKRWLGLSGRWVLIEIATPQGELTVDRLRGLLFKVFLPSTQENALIPSYWKPVLQGKIPGETTPGDRGTLSGHRIEALGSKNGVSAPVRLSTPDPPYTEEARANRLSGTIRLAVILDRDGGVHDVLETNLSLGRGLDQKAIETVREWKFKPALKDDVPVPVFLIVEINFRLFR